MGEWLTIRKAICNWANVLFMGDLFCFLMVIVGYCWLLISYPILQMAGVQNRVQKISFCTLFLVNLVIHSPDTEHPAGFFIKRYRSA